jgi:hypothetical protein
MRGAGLVHHPGRGQTDFAAVLIKQSQPLGVVLKHEATKKLAVFNIFNHLSLPSHDECFLPAGSLDAFYCLKRSYPETAQRVLPGETGHRDCFAGGKKRPDPSQRRRLPDELKAVILKRLGCKIFRV